MSASNLVALFIVITTAATLNATGVTDIQTSAQAAEALRAVAGPLTFAVFAAGIIGTVMLALPALAGSAAYALGETLSWHVGLARLPPRAKAGCDLLSHGGADATKIGDWLGRQNDVELGNPNLTRRPGAKLSG